jgi:uncharacterized protein (TIGR00304 family)
MLSAPSITELGFLLIIFGIAVALIAIVLSVVRSPGSSSGHSAGVLLIGPIPIIFGSDRQSVKGVMILAIILILLVLAVILLVPSLLGR